MKSAFIFFCLFVSASVLAVNLAEFNKNLLNDLEKDIQKDEEAYKEPKVSKGRAPASITPTKADEIQEATKVTNKVKKQDQNSGDRW